MRPPSFLRSASSIASSSIFSTSESHANPQPTIISDQSDQSEQSEHSVATDGTYRPTTNDDNEERILSNRIRLLTNGALSRHPSANMSLNFVGSHDFTPPTPVRTPRRSRASSFGSVDNRLSVIEEDRPSQPSHSHPTSSTNTHNRPFSRRFGLGEPPKYQQGRSPPNYTFWDIQGPKGEKFADLRNNAQVAKRGGWKRICIIGWLIVVLILALAVGLGVGLSKKHGSSSSSPAAAPSPSPSTATGPFPAGSYTFTTYLSTVSTNCTSNSDSWTCQPSVTYDSDPLGSRAQFNWIISTTNTTPTAKPSFTIASSSNPFAIEFSKTGLTLMDEGMDTERYSFKTTVPKIVYPTASVSIKCYYNDTQFSGNLYTKKPKTVSDPETGTGSASSSVPSSSGSSPYGEWKYAVDATQSIGGGVDVPDCYHYENGQDGSRITQGYEEEPQGSFCSCAYTNANPQ